uniref:Uncharacterized protein n=3 Tax=Arion vulgaris TaxID=1028688 RepID=A0A0B7AZA9_9EUPU
MVYCLKMIYFLVASLVVRSWAQSVVQQDSGTNVASTSVVKSPCWLVAQTDFSEQLSQYLGERAKLIEMRLHLDGHPTDMLHDVLKDVYNPYQWIRSTSRQGRSLLMLGDDYRYKSLSTLSIGVASLDVNVTDQPIRCIRGRSQEETLTIIRESFFRDFHDPTDGKKGTFGLEDHMCNIQIINNLGDAEFRYRCCQTITAANVSCHDLLQDQWVTFLLALIIIIKILVVLYSPLFVPDSLYRLKYVAGQYIYHVPDPPLTLKVVVTTDPDQFGEMNQHKTVRLSRLKNMEYFKTMVSNPPWIPDKIYQVHIQDVKLSVKARRLLDSATVPVSCMTILYNNLLRCRIRRLESLSDCCASDVLGKFNPGFKIIPWYKCMKLFAQLCLLVVLATPWIVRVVLYFLYEADVVENKIKAAQELGLKVQLPESVVLHLTPFHGLFIVAYIVFIIDSFVYGIISSGIKEKFKHVTKQCLRDMRERSRITILAWTTKLIVMPFKVFGIMGFIFFVPYVVILIIITFPLIAFYVFPTLNLSARLLIHFFIFMCPRRVIGKFEQWSQRLAPVKQYLKIHEATANENFVKRHVHSTTDLILQLIVIIMCLISVWSITLLLMELISFFVEIGVYTFMGLVVNAGVTLQYLTVLLLVFMYSKNIFSRVHRVYLSYHKVIHKQLMAMTKQEVTNVAAKEPIDQENTAFIVQGELAANKPELSVPVIRIKNHKIQWLTYGMLVFLDSYDTPLIPERFFYETTNLNYFGCPGPIYRNVCSAVREFLKIVLFLLFVFVVVMALGDAYQISTTNQVLATVIGGFVPFIFRNVFNSSNAMDNIDTSCLQFKTELHKAINKFTQAWPVFDISPVCVKEWDIHEPRKPKEKRVQPPKLVILSTSSSSESGSDDGNGTENTAVDDVDAGDDAATHNESSTVFAETDFTDIDIIVDVSSSNTRAADNILLNKDFEKGSVSMLDRSKHKTTAATRLYMSHETV